LSEIFSDLSYWPERIAKILLCSLPFVLAYLSWRFVEQPFRNLQFLSRKHLFALFAGLGGLLGAIAAWSIYAQGWPGRFQPEDMDILISHGVRSQYIRERFDKVSKNINLFNTMNKSRVLILGDSYAQDLLNMIHENSMLSNTEIRVRYMPARCQIYRGDEDAMAFIAKKDKKLCAKNTPRFYKGLETLVEQADIIVFAASWREWSAERLPTTLRKFGILPQTRVIVLGRKNFGDVRRKRYLNLSRENKIAIRNKTNSKHLRTNALMKQSLRAPNVEFIDLHALVCGENSETCPIFTPEGKLISHDGSHLTQAGARYLGHLLKEHSVLGTPSLIQPSGK
jgi:hypothetical protein